MTNEDMLYISPEKNVKKFTWALWPEQSWNRHKNISGKSYRLERNSESGGRYLTKVSIW